MWSEKIIEGLMGPQLINDSKTPSGRVHVGSLRGVLIHDALYRALRDKGTEVMYQYGIDDYDPLDGLPADAAPSLQEYMGHPLCNIPAPAGSNATDLADHYISEFLAIFPELGVDAQVYRMRDIYRSGRFNQVVDAILEKSNVVRKIYAEVSHAARPEDWYPFQVICENCGKIGTTVVTAYDGKEVTYHCKADLVSWAQGCGHQGKVSPFDGRGKLPWKLEWTAKWHTFGITIEGAGKDHCTKGGSRDVAARCLKEIFGDSPPLNVPYEFFLVSGAKMSSSKGVGMAAREIAHFLPPEILRFLIIRTPPKRTVNFSTDFEYIVRLFNEHDRLVQKAQLEQALSEKKMLRMIEIDSASTAYRPIGFQLLIALLQLPHIDVEHEIQKRTDGGLTEQDKENLKKRLSAAAYWLDNYASEEDRIELQANLPAAAVAELSHSQRAFLHLLGEKFPTEPQEEEAYQKLIFDIARLTPIDQKSAFAAIYRVLLDQLQGPKGGALFVYLDRKFLVQRFLEVNFSRDAFWHESGISAKECEDWLSKHRGQILSAKAEYRVNVLISAEDAPDIPGEIRGKGVIELQAMLIDKKTYKLRVLLRNFEGEERALDSAVASLEAQGEDFLDEMARLFEISIETAVKPIVYREYAGGA